MVPVLLSWGCLVANIENLEAGRKPGIKRPRVLSPEMKWIMDNLDDKKAVKEDKPTWTAKLRWIQETRVNKSWFMRRILTQMSEKIDAKPDEVPEEPPEEIAGKIDVLLAKWESEMGA